MKKIKLTEDQLNRLVLTEGMYDQIKVIYDMISTNPNIKTHPAADVDYTTISADLYDAVKGVGTTKDKILSAFNQIPDLPSLLKLKNTFRTNYGTDLLGWLDDDIDMDRTWNTYVYQPMIRMRNRSQELKHLEVEKSKSDTKMDPQVIENFKSKFPCIEETPGFEILRAEKTQDGKQQLRFKSSYGTIALQLNGVAWTWKNNKWVKNSQPLACPADAATAALNENQINEQGLQGFDQQNDDTSGTTQNNDNTQQSTGTTQNDNTQQSTGTTQSNNTQQSGGNWVANFQQQLKDAGYGSQLGTTGPNGDGVDGKLGPKTATAAYSLLKSKGIINETTVFKNEEDLKAAVEAHLSEEKELCGCGCEIGKCKCGPECTKCDCGKKKEAKEGWEPTGSVGVSGVAQDVARKGMNTLWENEDEDKKSLYCVCLKNNENVVVGYYRSIEIASEVFHGFTHNDNNPTTIREVKDHFEDGYKFCLLKRLERKPIKCYDNRKDVEEYIYKNSDKPEPSELYFSKFETNKVTQQPQDGQLSESVMNNFKRLIK